MRCLFSEEEKVGGLVRDTDLRAGYLSNPSVMWPPIQAGHHSNAMDRCRSPVCGECMLRHAQACRDMHGHTCWCQYTTHLKCAFLCCMYVCAHYVCMYVCDAGTVPSVSRVPYILVHQFLSTLNLPTALQRDHTHLGEGDAVAWERWKCLKCWKGEESEGWMGVAVCIGNL